jgi:hypothetical protein
LVNEEENNLTFDMYQDKIVYICYYILLMVFYLPQAQPDEQHVSSAEDEDEDGDGDAVAKGDVPVDDEEEEDEDPLINNSSEQLDNIRFDGGQLIDGYNYRYVLLV